MTQEGWAALVGVGARTVQRWEQGSAAPDAAAEAALLACCEAQGLLRRYAHGPFAGQTVSRQWLSDVVAEGRLYPPGSEPGAARPTSAPAFLPTQSLRGPLTELIGRDQALAALIECLPRARLLTLTGPGGTGKTRLARAAAERVADQFPDGVRFMSLAAIVDPNLVMPAVVGALGLSEHGASSALAILISALQERSALLVLDNFEQVLDAAGDVIELLAACPTVTALVTSRAPLRVRGERVFPVSPLAAPAIARVPSIEALSLIPAVQLFCERARDIEPGFRLMTENAATVAEICRRLDGLPLALELAAAQLRLFTPQALLGRLDRRLALLITGPRDLPTRQRTLRSTIEWSHNLLRPVEQMAFRRLAVFAGGCTLDAAEAVCDLSGDIGEDVIQVIASLIDQNLLQKEMSPDHEPRVGMLGTIQEFARERLQQSGEWEHVRRRHADHMLALAEEAAGHQAGSARTRWHDRLEMEHDNLRSAMSWCSDCGDAQTALRFGTALFWFWALRGHWTEGRAWFEEALARITAMNGPQAGGDPVVAARQQAHLLWCAGGLAWYQGELAAARIHLEQSMTLAQRAGARHDLAHATLFRGLTAFYQGDPPAARAFVEQSVALLRETGDRWNLADAVFILGDTVLAGDGTLAEQHYRQSLALYREMGDPMAAQPLTSLGHLALQRGEYAAARALLTEGLALRRADRDRLQLAISLASLGEAARCEGDTQEAHELLTEALTLSREVGHKPSIAWALCSLGQIALDRRRGVPAMALLREGLLLAAELDQKQRIAACFVGCAGVAIAAGRIDQAARLCGVIDALCDTLGVPLEPADRIQYERRLDSLRGAIQSEDFAAARTSGRSITTREAIAEALGLLEGVWITD